MNNKNISRYILSNFSSKDSHSVLSRIYQRVEGFTDEEFYDKNSSHLANARMTRKWLHSVQDSLENVLDEDNFIDDPVELDEDNYGLVYSYPVKSYFQPSPALISFLHEVGWSYFGSIHPDEKQKNKYKELAFTIIPRVARNRKDSSFLVAVGVLSGDKSYSGRYTNVNSLKGAKDYIYDVMKNISKAKYYNSLSRSYYAVSKKKFLNSGSKNKIDSAQERNIRRNIESKARSQTDKIFSDDNIEAALFKIDESINLNAIMDFISYYMRPLAEKNVIEAEKHEQQKSAIKKESLGNLVRDDIDDIDQPVDDVDDETVDSINNDHNHAMVSNGQSVATPMGVSSTISDEREEDKHDDVHYEQTSEPVDNVESQSSDDEKDNIDKEVEPSTQKDSETEDVDADQPADDDTNDQHDPLRDEDDDLEPDSDEEKFILGDTEDEEDDVDLSALLEDIDAFNEDSQDSDDEQSPELDSENISSPHSNGEEESVENSVENDDYESSNTERSVEDNSDEDENLSSNSHFKDELNQEDDDHTDDSHDENSRDNEDGHNHEESPTDEDVHEEKKSDDDSFDLPDESESEDDYDDELLRSIDLAGEEESKNS